MELLGAKSAARLESMYALPVYFGDREIQMAYYREVLAFHVIAIISWTAGILYLYRLLIYALERASRSRKSRKSFCS